MISRSTRYDLAKLGWAALCVGGAIYLYSGQASFVGPAQLPGEPFHGLVAGVALAAVGFLFVSTRETAAWKAAGRRAGLSPAGRSLFGSPDLSGTVDGRPVRVRTVKRRTGSSSAEGGSSKTTFTVVEAELDRPAEEGLIVTPASGGQTVGTSASYRIDAEYADVADDELAAVGSPEDVAREVISGRAREALIGVGDLVYVGDAAGALKNATGDVSDSRIGSWIQGKAADRVPGDESAVSVETKGLVLDGDRLREQAETVAAVAKAFEDATGGR